MGSVIYNSIDHLGEPFDIDEIGTFKEFIATVSKLSFEFRNISVESYNYNSGSIKESWVLEMSYTFNDI
jgi:hypothetical protein